MNPIQNLWDILIHDIYSETTNKPLTTKIELIERQIKVWFYFKRMTRFCKTFIENMGIGVRGGGSVGAAALQGLKNFRANSVFKASASC